jgi:hypothetical protein
LLDEVNNRKISIDKRVDALAAIGNTQDPHFLPTLRAVIQNPNEEPKVLAQAARSLGRIGRPEDVGILGELLKIKHPDVNKGAAEALGLVGGTRALQLLLENLSYSWETLDVTIAYFDAFRRIGDVKAVFPMLELYRNNGQPGITDFLVPSFPSRELKQALDAIGCDAVSDVLRFTRDIQSKHIYKLPMDIIHEFLTTCLKNSPEKLSTSELCDLSEIPDLWRVGVYGTVGDLDTVERIATETLDGHEIREMAIQEITRRKNLNASN